jgi:hypothetical protein
MKIFFVHGMAIQILTRIIISQWESDVTNQLKSSGVQTDPRYQGLTCDPLFQQYDHDPATYAGALVVFLGSAAVSWSTIPNKATKCIRFYLA